MKATAVLATCVACATSAAPRVRFANAPPVRVVDDRRDVPNRPATSRYFRFLYHFDGSFARRVTRALELRPGRRALGVNSVDEVPDSTWFTNRIGVRDLAPEDIRVGPSLIGSPEPHKPWTVRSSKIGGKSVGFVITDARGEKFLLKFDLRGYPETETAAHVIVGRLLWACGYNVTDDYIVQFARDDLVLARDAIAKDPFGKPRPLTRAQVDHDLDRVDVRPDGSFRGMASRILDGKPIGHHPAEGVRADDPNDRIPHQRRRDLRGAYAVFAWLEHTDITGGQFLDVWGPDPNDRQRRYVKHYVLDYGKSLGFHEQSLGDPRRGYEYHFDPPRMLGSLLSVGSVVRPWERRPVPQVRGVGWYAAAAFDPGHWHASTPAYVPLIAADRFDKFWGAKLVMRFTRAQLQAAVAAGELTDPRAAEYLVDALVARQRATGRYWFSRVSPIDNPVVRGDRLCFDDLMLAYALAPGVATRYVLTTRDRNGRIVGTPRVVSATPSGSACVQVELAGNVEGYTIVEIELVRGGRTGRTDVHLARDPVRGTPRVIGMWRW